MEWFLSFCIFFAVSIAGLYYATSEKMVGSEAARRNLRLTPWLLYGLALAFILAFILALPGRKVSVIINIVYAVWISTYLVVLGFSKQEAGALLAKIGRTSLGKLFIFLLDLSVFAFAIYQTWFFSTLVSNGIPKYASLEQEISRLVIAWAAFSFCIALGSNELEFRENGIFFRGSLVTWQRINSYTFEWEPFKSNNLTIRFKPRFPLFPESMSMGIPEKHIDMVSHILGERLPGKSL
jgi:Domain of unknown function (DUF5673)